MIDLAGHLDLKMRLTCRSCIGYEGLGVGEVTHSEGLGSKECSCR